MKTHKGFEVKVAFNNTRGFTHKSEYYYDNKGIARWTTNDAPVPLDAAREYKIEISADHSAAIDEHTRVFMEEYRKQRAIHGYSEEEKAEMRAAFGPGEIVVDIVTGKKFKT